MACTTYLLKDLKPLHGPVGVAVVASRQQTSDFGAKPPDWMRTIDKEKNTGVESFGGFLLEALETEPTTLRRYSFHLACAKSIVAN